MTTLLSSFRKKFIKNRKLLSLIRNKPHRVFLGVLIIISLIFILSIRDRNYYLGGDLIFPINSPSNIIKSLYLWDLENGGVSFFKYMYLVWQFMFYIPSFFHIPPDIGIKIFIIFLYVIGTLFTYLTYKTLFKKTKYDIPVLGIFASVFFILHPVGLQVLNGFYPLYCIPVCVYFILTYLDKRNFWNLIPFAFFLNLGYFSDLPQARNIFIIAIVLFFMVLVYKITQNISWKQLLQNLIVAGILTFLLNAFVLLPFFYDAFKPNGAATTFAQSITVYDGNADLFSAALPFTQRFTNFNLFDQSDIGKFLAGKKFILWTTALMVLALSSVFFVPKKDKKIAYLFIVALVTFFFIAKGANPPFGEIYKYLLFHVPLLRIIRSSTTVVIGGALFYAFLITLTLYFVFKRNTALAYCIVCVHILIFSPLYTGKKLLNFSVQGAYKGEKIPLEYIAMGKRLDTIAEDTKILSLPIDDGYEYTDWGHNGVPFLLWLTQKSLVHSESGSLNSTPENQRIRSLSQSESCTWVGIKNLGYIVHTKDAIDNYPLSEFSVPSQPVISNAYLALRKIDQSCQMPHIYPAKYMMAYKGNSKDVSFLLSRMHHQTVTYMPTLQNKEFESYFPSQSIEGVIKGYDQFAQALKANQKSTFNPFQLHYIFTVPSNEKYTIITDQQDAIASTVLSNEPIDIQGKVDFPKGENTLTVILNQTQNLLDAASWVDQRTDPNKTFIVPSVSFTKPILMQEIIGWEKGTVYEISFNYDLHQHQPINLILDEQWVNQHGRTSYPLTTNTLNVPIGNGSLVGSYSLFVRSRDNATNARIYFDNLNNKTTISSMKIQKIVFPRIILQSQPPAPLHTPHIAFRRVNPTKYMVSVTNNSGPLVLIFSENFSSGWKVARVPTSSGKTPPQKTIATYEGGSVIEKSSTDSFATMDDLFPRTVLSESKHFVANGFANGWVIDTHDVNGAKTFDLVIFYEPQRIFLIGVIISLLTLVLGSILQLKHTE